MLTRINLLLEGSLFFKGLTALLNFLGRMTSGSFIAGLFINDYKEANAKHSRFGFLADKLLNSFPKVITPPDKLPKAYADVISGSWLLNTLNHALETVVRPGGKAPYSTVWRWGFYMFPIWGLLAVLTLAPFFPTMMLAGMLVLVFAFTLFRQKFVIEQVSIAVLVFILVTLFSGVTSFHPASSIPIALLTSVIMLSFLLILSLCHSQKQVDFFFFAFLAASAGTGLVGLYQFAMRRVDMTWVDTELVNDIPYRVVSTFDNPNVYATYLLLAIPLAAALVLYAKKPMHKFIAFAVTGLLLVNLLITYSRGCYLALAVSVLFFVLIVEKRLIILAMVGLIGLIPLLPPAVLNRLVSITNFADSSISYRIFIWQGTLRILRDFWMTGLGQGIDAYNVIYPYYAFNAVVAPHSHNLFLQVFVETGIVGLLVFLSVLAWFFRCQARFMRRADDWRHKVVSAAMTAAVVGFLFQGIFDYVFYNYRVMLIFFLYIGLACAFARLPRQAGAAA